MAFGKRHTTSEKPDKALVPVASIKTKRKLKKWAIQLKLHRILGPFAGAFHMLDYMTRLSRWVHQTRGKLGFDDFPNPNPKHSERFQLYDWVSQQEKLSDVPVSYLEFGVGRGNSMRWWSGHNTNPNTRYFGFDTFEGLPEQYGEYGKEAFDVGGNYPDIDDERINFVPGLFQNTLLNKLPEVDFSNRVILHIDGDLYSSALYPLTILAPHLKEGDIIIFDEFGVPHHEFRAFLDFTRTFYLKLTPLGAINNYLQVAFRMDGIQLPKFA